MPPKKKLFLLLFFLWASLLSAQNPQMVWRNYTSEDGLPSNEVHYCLQTSDGYMWFATDNGLSRFDGYSFKNYGVQEGLGYPVIYNLQLDPQGRLWMATGTGELFFLEGDSIQAFSANDTILALQDKFQAFYDGHDFYIDQSGSKYLTIHYMGILEVGLGGKTMLHQSGEVTPFHLAKKIKKKWMYSFSRMSDSLSILHEESYFSKGKSPPLGINIESDSFFLLEGIPHRYMAGGLFIKEFSNGRILSGMCGFLSEIDGKEVLWSRPEDLVPQGKSVFESPTGTLLCGYLNNQGMRFYQDLDAWRENKYQQYLPGKSVTQIFEDLQGNLWVGTLEDGVFMCSRPSGELYDQQIGLSAADVSALAFKNEKELFLSMRRGDIFLLNTITHQLTPLPSISWSAMITDLVYAPSMEELWAGVQQGVYLKNEKWNKVPFLTKNGKKGYFTGKNISLRKNSKTLWGGSSHGFSAVDLGQKKVTLHSGDLGTRKRTLAIWPAMDSTIWIANPDGLFVLKKDSLHRPYPFHHAFNTRVDDIAELSDGSLVAASKGQGVFVFKDSLFQQFTIADGLTANMIENVYVDERNTIWAGTLNGLNRISGFSWSGDQQLRIKQFTTKNGLPSDEINKVEVWEDEVWVATTKGLIHFQNQIETDSFSRAPIIKGVSINGKVLDSIQSFSRAHTDNDLIFHFLTLNFRQDGQIPYRYRLQPVHSDWRETRVTQVNYSTLRPGRYVFEVQSQNEDGIWSNSTPFAFRIRPPWWESWWAISLGILGVASLGLGIYKYRTGQLKKELSLERQLAEVERQALRSQMNPHFIFNSLNAIQGYIAIGDKASANRYLSRFAKLIRAALQHSRLTKVPLDEDIRSLQNYLELEQLRFQDRFDFHFQVAENIDAERVEIPPLLVQPFVENAIVHGMASKTEKGLIEIDYALKDDVLKVTVLDNGIGIEASKNRKLNLASSHKSIGLTVTRRRLEMLTGNGEAGKVYIQELKDEHGNTMGTKAVVWIPV